MAQTYEIKRSNTKPESEYTISECELHKLVSELQKGEIQKAAESSGFFRSTASSILNRMYDPTNSRHRVLVCEVYRILKTRGEKYPVSFPNIPWLEAWYTKQVAKTPNAAHQAAGGE